VSFIGDQWKGCCLLPLEWEGSYWEQDHTNISMTEFRREQVRFRRMRDGHLELGVSVGLDLFLEKDKRADDVCAVCFNDKGKVALSSRVRIVSKKRVHDNPYLRDSLEVFSNFASSMAHQETAERRDLRAH
jgi:hypothetical protein